MSDETTTSVKITIDGREIEAQDGELVIAAAERTGTYIPRFCWHPRMNPVGMCRMCLVEIDTGRGPALQPSCMIPVADGMTVSTDSDATKKAQEGVLEFLLANHPLDCPVCDKGGECPLQDQAYSHGPGESRFIEEKVHFEKPIAISELVDLDRERCILCDRCTRFADEVAGDALIHFIDRGAQTQVNTFPDEPFASYFSGNTVQICPVGALTARPYRFKARPWDLEQVESTCTSCSVGCRVAVQSSRNEVLRYQGVDVDPVNWGWLCDKGRFDFQALNSPDRLGQPLVRTGDELASTTWADALGRAGSAIKAALESSGPAGVGVVGGSRLTNESAYAWAKLAKGVIGTDNVDCQLGDGLPAEAVLGLPRATIDQACAPGGTVLLVGVDPKEELPVLHLRLRHAVIEDKATVIEVVPHGSGLTGLAAHSLVHAPGAVADVVAQLVAERPAAAGGLDADAIAEAATALRAGPVTVVLGRGSLADRPELAANAAARLAAALPEARFLSGLRRGNVHGALDAGLAPGLLPGRVSLDDARAWFHDHWSTVPSARGLDTEGILAAAADGKLDVLVLLGADPLSDFPDHDLARRALAGARTVIAVDTLPNPSVRQADVVLPAAGYAETDGTTTNLEGRVSVLSQKVTPPGTARADWIIAAELAYRLGDDLGLESVDDVFAELTRVAPSHRGLTLQHVGVDGVVVPLDRPDGGGDQRVADDPEGLHTAGGTDEPDAGVDADAAAATAEAEASDTDEAAKAAEAEATVAQADHEAAEAAEERESAAPAAPAGPDLPATVRFDAPAVTVPPLDSYKLRLVTTRELYDLGTTTQASPALAPLARGAQLRLHPHDFDRLGVQAGTEVTMSNREGGRGSVTVPAHPAAGVPKGAAHLVFLQPGASAAELVDVTSVVTDVRVEVAR
ncbi:MAG TPA: NADH-quinone oxidoreductase subunit NuoG [Acidimicrobiales bacterium]|nr:NADH-quinone oxidoreductase subunit NuoG [Acidimicrobiales bacterium]